MDLQHYLHWLHLETSHLAYCPPAALPGVVSANGRSMPVPLWQQSISAVSFAPCGWFPGE
jgi:hypothetical protein